MTDGIIRIPRYYGIQKFGLPTLTKYKKNKPAKIKFNGTLRDYQIPIVDTCLNHIVTKGGGLLVVPCGTGKCLGIGTQIIMYDGTIKNVEDIKIGDRLMGDDSTPRNVLSLARGREEMYNIIDINGENYIVNKSHILSLKSTTCIVDVSVQDYINNYLNNNINLKGYRVAINFEQQEIFTDPYLMGCQLSDEIPYIYKCNSFDVRLKVLAGLLDSYFSDKFEIIQKNNKLAHDIVFLCRSLGFSSYKTTFNNIEDNCIYHVVTLNGNFLQIPILKPKNNYQHINNLINLEYDIVIKPLGIDNYYGFELDGNHRFLLGDLTVTHNTSMAIYIASQLKAKTLIITHKTFLQEQWIARCKQFTNSNVGIIRQKIVDIDNKDFVIAMIQSLAKRNYDPEIFKQFDFVVCDETHHFSSRCFSQALAKCSAKYTMGLTATPYRSDGLMHVVNWFLGDIMYEKRIKTNNQVVVKIITFKSTDPLFKEKKRWIQGKVRPDCVKMITNLIQIKQRNEHIINIINSLRKSGERKILILSGRKEHLNELKSAVDLLIQSDIDNGLVDGDENRTYFYTGETKKNDRFEAEQYADILFATYDMAHEGLDIDRLNTIILATPKPDVNQAVGRIMRKILKTGDIRPLIIDIVDKLSIFVGQSEKREKFYEKSKYISQYYYMLNENFISYAPEDRERIWRFKKLGYNVNRIDGTLYHLDHFIGPNSSMQHQYSQANNLEYTKIQQMDIDELRRYISSWIWIKKYK